MRSRKCRMILSALLAMLFMLAGVCVAEESGNSYLKLTKEYLNAHFLNMAEDFSEEHGILEQVQAIMIKAGMIAEDAYEEGSLPNPELEIFCRKHGRSWDGLISIPILYELYDEVDATPVYNNEATSIKVDSWTRTIWNDGNFFIGETDDAMNLVVGLYYFAAEDVLYWGTFDGKVRDGQGVALYPNNDCYYGSWDEDLMSGYGVYYFEGQGSGEYYGGYWENGMMNGEGTYVKNGKYVSGTWKDNQLIR